MLAELSKAMRVRVKRISIGEALVPVLWYICTMKKHASKARPKAKSEIERVQTGVRLEKRLLKVLKGLAEYMDVSLGELIEVIVLSSFEGSGKFSKGTLAKIADLKRIYDLDYGIEAANMMLFSADRRK
jgi:predicted DNA-binding ribbon-helix-helix protein